MGGWIMYQSYQSSNINKLPNKLTLEPFTDLWIMLNYKVQFVHVEINNFKDATFLDVSLSSLHKLVELRTWISLLEVSHSHCIISFTYNLFQMNTQICWIKDVNSLSRKFHPVRCVYSCADLDTQICCIKMTVIACHMKFLHYLSSITELHYW